MKTACMVVHAYYPEDPRVRREAEALAASGCEVDIICLRNMGESKFDSVNGVRVHRLPVRRHRGSGKSVYIVEYLTFFLLAALRLSLLYKRNRYPVVQVHNLPDFLVFAASVPKLLGSRIVLDLHDLTPELYKAKYRLPGDSPALAFLKWVEKRSTSFADHVITSSELFRNRLVERGVAESRITVIVNSPDPNIFSKQLASHRHNVPHNGVFRLIYHGTLAERYGLDVAVKAVQRLSKRIPFIHFDIYGRGEERSRLENLVVELGLESHVHFHGYVELNKVPEIILAADMALVPLQKNEHTDLAFPTKLFEYISLRVPSVVSKTSVIEEMFSDRAVAFFAAGEPGDLAAVVLALYRNREKSEGLASQALREFQRYKWERVRETYVELIQGVA